MDIEVITINKSGTYCKVTKGIVFDYWNGYKSINK